MGISPTQLLIILAIVALVFGTKKLRNMGGDLGGAVRGFKKAMSEDEKLKHEKETSFIDQAAGAVSVAEKESAS